MVVILGLVGAALAEPTFVGLPGDVATAEMAWAEATKCAGWEANAHDEVRIDMAADSKWAGHAEIGPGGLEKIVLDPENIHRHRRRVLLHEVSHAWTSFRWQTPAALEEGLTDLMVECIHRNRPDLGLEMKDRGQVIDVPDLEFWRNEEGATDKETAAGYLASLRLVRAAAFVVGERVLWPENPAAKVGWPWFWNMMSGDQPRLDAKRAIAEAKAAAADAAAAVVEPCRCPWTAPSYVAGGAAPPMCRSYRSSSVGRWCGILPVQQYRAVLRKNDVLYV